MHLLLLLYFMKDPFAGWSNKQDLWPQIWTIQREEIPLCILKAAFDPITKYFILMTWTFSQHSSLLLQKSQDESILTFYKNVEVKPKHLMSRQEIPAYDNVLQHDDFNSIIPNVCCWCSHFLWQILVGRESSCSLQSWLYGNWTVSLSQRKGGAVLLLKYITAC